MDTGIFIGDKVITTSWDKIRDKPNTLSGYGITDAVTIDTAQEIYGIKEFANTVYISTASDTMLAFKSLDDENFAIIDVRNKTGNSLSKFGYYSDRWAIDSNTILHTGNDEYLSLNYGVLGTVCALSVSKYVKQLEDRVTLLENKIASLQ